MKKIKTNMIKVIVGLLLIISVFGCETTKQYYDNVPPSPPRNIKTYVGDNAVEIDWDFNPERDVAGYNVYYSDSYYGKYTLIGSTKDNFYVDFDAQNGVKYYYAVSAYDVNGNESELSYDEVYGVARPEGKNQVIFDYLKFPDMSGYDFSEYLVTAYDSSSDQASADMFFENFNGVYYIDVWDDTDIQDMGQTNDLSDITEAPLNGWVPLQEGENIKYAEAIVGHTYIIWTWDNHFAKVRIDNITPEKMVFDWAYQLMEGEVQLKSGRGNSKSRNLIHKKVVRKR